MKIAVRGGHNFSVPGARGILDETKEDRKVKDAVIKYLKALGHNVIDATSPDSCNSVSSDLNYGVNKANNFGADLFISCHFNNAYTSYAGAIGTEVCVYNASNPNKEAKGVLNKLVSLGFKNRGIKERTGLFELRAANMTSMIVEICFVEATDDVNLYRSVGFDGIGKAIAEGAVSSSINAIPDNRPSTVTPESSKSNFISDLQKVLNKLGSKLDVDGILGNKTLDACPTLKKDSNGELVTLLQKRLIALGFSCGASGADGSFGNGTLNAVIAFQKKSSLDSDGVVGNNTWKNLLKNA